MPTLYRTTIRPPIHIRGRTLQTVHDAVRWLDGPGAGSSPALRRQRARLSNLLSPHVYDYERKRLPAQLRDQLAKCVSGS
jgi:hypothetical protein